MLRVEFTRKRRGGEVDGATKRQRIESEEQEASEGQLEESLEEQLEDTTEEDTTYGETKRKQIDISTLDLDKSYEDEIEWPPKKVEQPRKRWTWEEGIMPGMFEQRLEQYRIVEAQREKLKINEPEGLSWDVYTRINTLKEIKEDVLGNDEYVQFEQVPSIDALLELIVGKQLSQPRRFDWDEFEALNKAHEGHKGFLVEAYPMSLRLVGYPGEAQIDVLHDTGSSVMLIWQSDLRLAMGALGPPEGYPAVISVGMTQIGSEQGTLAYPVVEVEVRLPSDDDDNSPMTRWTRGVFGVGYGTI
ncbi:hypothetical protein N7478_011426 [Penicillium angulare]|uniref:uncharacterized protein n=1 Tax=Penicillium angulare TaxID=116970 RepID=UPI00254019B6|nr:uncharacterized protein N7478_011426 [Penicillium angulare]KAJ5263821.1 hypothetical protein N7478_011426 [Penicillium angulare]